jgi:hypothetical protein
MGVAQGVQHARHRVIGLPVIVDDDAGDIHQEAAALARRKLFELADIAASARNRKPTTISPIAFEAVQRFDAIFMLERSIAGLASEARVAVRRKDVAPLVNDLVVTVHLVISAF